MSHARSRRDRASLLRSWDYSLGAEYQRVTAQPKMEPQQFRRAAVRIVRPVKPRFAAQRSHVDIHAVLDALAKDRWQLIEPHLPYRRPVTFERPPQEILVAPTSPIDAVLHAQQDARPDPSNCDRDRAPDPIWPGFEALVPNRPNEAGFYRGKQYHFVFDDRVASETTARCILGRKRREPSILHREPAAV